jgi:hypothetical protein
LPASAAARAGVNEIAAGVGNPTPDHLLQARYLLGHMPRALRETVHEPFAARAVVYGLLLHADKTVRKHQLKLLHEKADPDVFRLTMDLEKPCHDVDAPLRLVLVDLVVPALRQMSGSQYNVFRSNVRGLIKMDNRVSLFEYVLHRVLLQHLDATLRQIHPPSVKYSRFKQVRDDCFRLLATLAFAGHAKNDEAKVSFAAGMKELNMQETMPLRAQCGLKQVDTAIGRIRLAAPLVKQQVVRACVACVLADKHVATTQYELLRAICVQLDCPMPPMLPSAIKGKAG